MSAITREDAVRRLRTVKGPELHKDQVKNDVAQAAAAELGAPFLGGIPRNARIREFGEAGTPEKTFTSAGELLLKVVEKVAFALAGQISIRSMQPAAQPTLSIE